MHTISILKDIPTNTWVFNVSRFGPNKNNNNKIRVWTDGNAKSHSKTKHKRSIHILAGPSRVAIAREWGQGHLANKYRDGEQKRHLAASFTTRIIATDGETRLVVELVTLYSICLVLQQQHPAKRSMTTGVRCVQFVVCSWTRRTSRDRCMIPI
jgi:hypothetical protein